jgi:hypothetical protein
MVDVRGAVRRRGRPSKKTLGDPHLDRVELDWFDELLTDTGFLLEYGSGGSTLRAVKAGVSRVMTVDTDAEWLTLVAEQCAGFPTHLELIHCDLGRVGEWGVPKDKRPRADFRTYAIQPWMTIPSDTRPDLVLVDGRFRVACLLASLTFSKPGTPILVDDYTNRPEYHVVEKYAKPHSSRGEMVLFYSSPPVFSPEFLSDYVQYSLDFD